MAKLKNCPCCGGDTILCHTQNSVGLVIDFSIICLDCGMEFKVRKSPTDNIVQYVFDPAKTAQEIIGRFNRRAKVEE